jgi:hypothetical protein
MLAHCAHINKNDSHAYMKPKEAIIRDSDVTCQKSDDELAVELFIELRENREKEIFIYKQIALGEWRRGSHIAYDEMPFFSHSLPRNTCANDFTIIGSSFSRSQVMLADVTLFALAVCNERNRNENFGTRVFTKQISFFISNFRLSLEPRD